MTSYAPTTAGRPRRGRTARGALLLALPLIVGVPVAAPALAAPPARPAAAAAVGWLRLAHLSPDTPNVDVYLAPFGGTGKPLVLRSVGYGDVSAYQAVPPGTYSASMRLAGAAGDSTPVLRANARVAAGKAYTAAAVGLRSGLAVKVISDDLTSPAAGKGRVRLISASTRADAVDVTAVGGPLLAQGTRFGRATGYAEVPAGRWTLKVTPEGGTAKPLTTTVDVPAGRVSSLLVLDGKATDSLKVSATVDSEGSAAMPTGGVNTGNGPAAGTRSPSPLPWAAGGLAAVLASGLGALLAMRARKARPRARHAAARA